MRLKVLLMVCCLALCVTAASAATEYLKLATMGAQGWTTTVKPDYEPRGGVFEKVNYYGEPTGTFMFTNGDKDKTVRCWGAISTANFDGMQLSQFTALNIRLNGIEGDGTAWSPPHFVFALKASPTLMNHRFVEWVPWADGVARAPMTWQTYNAMVDGEWYLPWTGQRFSTMSALLAAWPDLTFANATEIQTLLSGFLGKSFNLGFADWLTEVQLYNDSARGLVDWFEVGIGGVNTTYYLNEVPEPTSLLALATGLIGFVGLRRRH